jgi:hypothetical protein
MKAQNWLAQTLYPNRPQAARPASPSLADQWRTEVEAARSGASWFLIWSSACQSRWAASVLCVADDAALDVPAELCAWLENLARGYTE